MDPAQDEGPPALRRQRVENGLKMAQLVARVQRFLGRIVGLEHIEFGDQFERDDLLAPGLVDQ